ncbi:hypothetical protein AUEXF2481DRAFT_26529 [Aureobasidium subglaciale EXF-2481]|uniref:BTB domain-containing protein n=1 Tax=Aureobasidium subglaciale (strain EXF-2481) TaxID=1043005 RepID=A0A074YPU3_AURSE|nr:uncharacterized protein AUEXF2481DRAFT_26529 [Aureobasidium subglaciale EXF-2481]KAI5200807.1 hypothetical protein E4T38_06343 [Aureobasidium subglaciale]KAI5219459.1 hypothetical protein E4T40_06405 [Aureobasidium subglaciale]KAI5223179.1 hypothetical protein E4T41_06245 [Aureobasidium subglaciale]KAI5259780.1 hypothetical protein E4T46_06680 [Aureobasidium subglaciale]KEQ98134.1 hypothetical protein AUEXF2481DRAFT_26529 [Aureobasidium subglaciale EXF-2481]
MESFNFEDHPKEAVYAFNSASIRVLAEDFAWYERARRNRTTDFGAQQIVRSIMTETVDLYNDNETADQALIDAIAEYCVTRYGEIEFLVDSCKIKEVRICDWEERYYTAHYNCTTKEPKRDILVAKMSLVEVDLEPELCSTFTINTSKFKPPISYLNETATDYTTAPALISYHDETVTDCAPKCPPISCRLNEELAPPPQPATYLDEISTGALLKFDGKARLSHKKYLISSSKAFEAAFSSDWTSAAIHSYDIQGYSKEAVDIMLHCIAYKHVDRPFLKHSWNTLSTTTLDIMADDVDFCLEVFLLADEHDINELRRDAVHNINKYKEQALERNDDAVADTILDMVVNSCEENALENIYLLDELAEYSGQQNKDHSDLFDLVQTTFKCDRGYGMDEWECKTENPKYMVLVAKVNEAKSMYEDIARDDRDD